MTQSGQGGTPQPGAPWDPDPASGYPAYPGQPQQAYGEQPHPGQPQQAYGEQPYPGQPQQAYGEQPYPEQPHPGAAYGYPQAYPAAEVPPGHVVGPGYEGPGAPHGYGYPPLPEAATQYIPPVPAAPAAPAHDEAATQFIPPVPAHPGHDEAATQYIAPVPAHADAATQYIPPVPAEPAAPAASAVEGFDDLFRGDDSAGHTQHLPPVQEPVLRGRPARRPYPPRGQGPVPPHAHQQHPHPQHPQPPHQQYAPPPPAEPSRKVSPAIIGAVVIGLATVGLGVGTLLPDGKPRNSDPGAVPVAPTASGGSAAPAEAPVDPARPQAVQLDKLLADSNDSRAAVIKAVEDIKSCANLGQAASDLRDAARQREELVTRLQELKLDKLPDHARLSAALTKAWKASADADNSYAAWADDVDDDDKCKDGKAKANKNAAEGNKSSGEATRAKESAATMWNTIAAKYGLTKRDKSQL